MNVAKPLFWHQGLFLQPQHLQYADLHHSAAAYDLQTIVCPFPYGMIRLEVHEGALNNAVVEVGAIEMLFPDGTYVSHPGNAVLPARSFSGTWQDKNQPFTVYVGVKKLDPTGGNVTVADPAQAEEVKTRYITPRAPDDMADLHQSGPNATIQTMLHVLRLFWEHEIEEAHDYELMPVAQLVHDAGETGLSATYIPPCLHLEASSVLLGMVKVIRDELAHRMHQLEDYKTPVSSLGTEIEARSIPYRLTLQLLSNYAPTLIHLTETPTVHPWHLYGLLRQLIGGLSTLSDRIDFQGKDHQGNELLPHYNHHDLSSCFESAQRVIIRLLNEITVGTETLISLECTESGRYRAAIPEDRFEPQNDFYLAMRTDAPFAESIQPFLKYGKIGSSRQIESFVKYALPGMGIEHLTVYPEGLPRRPNATYFKLLTDDPIWDDIRQTGTMVMIWDRAPDDLKPELIVVRR